MSFEIGIYMERHRVVTCFQCKENMSISPDFVTLLAIFSTCYVANRWNYISLLEGVGGSFVCSYTSICYA